MEDINIERWRKRPKRSHTSPFISLQSSSISSALSSSDTSPSSAFSSMLLGSFFPWWGIENVNYVSYHKKTHLQHGFHELMLWKFPFNPHETITSFMRIGHTNQILQYIIKSSIQIWPGTILVSLYIISVTTTALYMVKQRSYVLVKVYQWPLGISRQLPWS